MASRGVKHRCEMRTGRGSGESSRSKDLFSPKFVNSTFSEFVFSFFQRRRSEGKSINARSKARALSLLCFRWFRFLSFCRGLLDYGLSAQTESNRAKKETRLHFEEGNAEKMTTAALAAAAAPNASSGAASSAAATQVAVRFVTRLPLEYRVPDEPVVSWGQDKDG